MREMGRLEQVDDGLVALVRSAAEAVDSSPGRASLIKEYRECLVLLAEVGKGQETDGFADLLAELRGATMGDAAPS